MMASAAARPKVKRMQDAAEGPPKLRGESTEKQVKPLPSPHTKHAASSSQAPLQSLKQSAFPIPGEQREQRQQPQGLGNQQAVPSGSRMAGLAQRSMEQAGNLMQKVDAGKVSQGVKQVTEKTPTSDASGADKVSKEVQDLSSLDGLEVSEGGMILDESGQAVGQVVEGDPEDLVGWTVSANGEILDDDGDVIGYVDLIRGGTTETTDAKGLSKTMLQNLKDLPIDAAGMIKDETGRLIGQVVEGKPDLVAGMVPNEKGEVLDDEGELIGRVDVASVSPEKASEAVEQPKPETGLSDISVLKGRELNEEGKIVSDAGDVIGQLTEGQDAKKLAGKPVDAQGQVIDDYKNVLGKVELVPGEASDAAIQRLGEQGEQVQEPVDEVSRKLPDISTLQGLACNKLGTIIAENGAAVGEVIEGDPKSLWKQGFQLDSQGQFWDHQGNIVGKAQPIPLEEEPAGIFSGLGEICVAEGGWIQDENGNRVGKLVDGDPKKLVGHVVDDDGDIVDKRGNVIGHVEPWEEPEPEEMVDFSTIESLSPNKMGNVIGQQQVPIARVVEGDLKEVAGRPIDRNGKIWNDKGEVIGRVEYIPDWEVEEMGIFSGLGVLVVDGSGFVRDEDENIVGKIVEGDPKSLRGKAVDDDGEILDKYGNVKGRAERYEPPEEEEEEPDLSLLEGMKVNKLGNVVDSQGTVFGRVVDGNPKKLVGKTVDANGQIWSDAGKVIGQAECIPDTDRERPEGAFSGLEGLTLDKDGRVIEQSGQVVGRLLDGDPQRLRGRAVDEDGEIVDKLGNVIGRAERWEPEDVPREISPMAGRKVNKEGEVRDADGNLIGKVTEGNLSRLVGKTIDDNGYILDNDGNKLGECTLIENLSPELSPEDVEKQQQEMEDKRLAKKMSAIVQQTLDTVGPLCTQITQHIEKAHNTPKEELDEEKLVNEVKPLIEKAGDGLQECKGALRALDPDGQVAARAKARSAMHEATPEEYQLADSLKELTKTVVETIENGRRLIADMPHAKKKINPLWALLSEPLFQIIAAVGLLLSGVLGLVVITISVNHDSSFYKLAYMMPEALT
ncbi:hypothetical protein UA08_02200 [Talaromyces atroroseus]|uniref:DUF6987 domain-containing protein n=1 Tax=Talaromyces atroroseus TaxID=1441469 RepID=A0A225B488_TALAT|nr:hypothetical protein UA08_02200 [Talaromyces atroroseus]OKL61665.1 hypothetical protein UA08_02200 [Talaromyces atroroseus]